MMSHELFWLPGSERKDSLAVGMVLNIHKGKTHTYCLKRLCPFFSQTLGTKLQTVVNIEYLQVAFRAIQGGEAQLGKSSGTCFSSCNWNHEWVM